MAGRTRSFSGTSRKRRTTWEGSTVIMPDIVVGTQQVNTIVSEANMENFPNPTIIRVRGRLAVTQDTAMLPGGIAIATMGLIVVTNVALAAGVAAIPNATLDIGADWLWTDTAVVGEETSSTVIGRTISVDRILVDSKSMRKVQPNQVLVLAIDVVNGSPSATAAVNVNGRLRVLLKAP